MITKNIKSNFSRSKEAINAFWIIVCRIARMVVSFLISILTARYLGPSNFGLINYATAYVTFFTSLCTLGINGVIIKDFLNYPKEQGSAIGTSILFRSISSSLSVIIIVVIVSILDRGDGLTIGVAFLCSLALIFQSMDTINYWFQSKYLSKVGAVAGLIGYTISSIFKVGLFVCNASVLFFAFSTSIDYIIEAMILYFSYKHNNGPKLIINFSIGKRLISQSYHYILSGMMVAIYGQVDRLMLKQMLNESAVGYYSLAASINMMWVFVLQAVIDSMYPTILKLYNIDRKAFERKNMQLYSVVIYLSAFISIMFILFGRIAIVLLYGEVYLPSANVLNVITWYTIFSYLGVARNAWLICENKQKYLKYIYVVAVFLNIVLNYFFIGWMGTYGAALASLITQIGTSIVIPLFIPALRPNLKLIFGGILLRGFKKA